jgi:hypothetical protein
MSKIPMYVASLFKELDFLGIAQRDVARHFGLSEGMVSQWARGVKPLPVGRSGAFLDFVRQAEQNALEAARTQSPRPHANLLTRVGGLTPEEQLQQKLGEFWRDWHLEIEERSGRVYEDLADQFRVLAPYTQMDLEKLRDTLKTSPLAQQTRTTVTVAAKDILRLVRLLERMPSTEEGR